MRARIFKNFMFSQNLLAFGFFNPGLGPGRELCQSVEENKRDRVHGAVEATSRVGAVRHVHSREAPRRRRPGRLA